MLNFEGWVNAGSSSGEVNPSASARAYKAAGVFLDAEATFSPKPGLVAGISGDVKWRDEALHRVDTENGPAAALLEAYRRRGENFIDMVGGRFFCCIVDAAQGKTLLATDRIGRHTLYYTVFGGTLFFAKRLDDLLALSRQGLKIDNQALYDYVYFHMVPSPGTIARGIHKLPGAHVLSFMDEKASTRRYWLPEFQEGETDFEALRDQLYSTLTQSVSPYSGQDGTGAFLSGGLDSSTVVGLMTQSSGDPVRAYSIGFPEEAYNELGYARIVAGHFGAKLREYIITPEDTLDVIPRIAEFYDEPFGNSSALPAYFCARVAREDGIERMVAGDGGDELFAGNTRYLSQRIFEAYHRVPGVLREKILEPLFFQRPWSNSFMLLRKASRYIEQARVPLPDRLDSYNFLHRHDPREVFSMDFIEGIDTMSPLYGVRETYDAPANASSLNRMLYLDWKRTLQDNDLVKVNYMCEMAGVDVVYPLLDDEVIELSCRVPSDMKIRKGRIRHFYKKAMEGFLPDAVLSKKKHGFGLPFGVWSYSYEPLQELAYGALADLKKRGIFRADFIDRAIDMHRNEHAHYYGELVWILMMLELWLASH